ncbi:hypothetical protein PoB_002109900 [Plakobranchus ocellatus]|uniref:Uncharacterized protein n=1 Tax=Plakobranchus ocellatus TaxID=259542 RepID=A0AAV3ZJR2_9GAST|nr:hypothetical protein PoB_002109900 [Plakobranchus ocellatus]
MLSQGSALLPSSRHGRESFIAEERKKAKMPELRGSPFQYDKVSDDDDDDDDDDDVSETLLKHTSIASLFY